MKPSQLPGGPCQALKAQLPIGRQVRNDERLVEFCFTEFCGSFFFVCVCLLHQEAHNQARC